MTKTAKKHFSDLRPNATIVCLRCSQVKPQAGSRKFRAHHVCHACAVKLQALPATGKTATKSIASTA